MKLNKKYQYIIFCEDDKTRSFIINILVSQGININKIRSDVAPSGRGSGEAYVRNSYRRNLSTLRKFNYNSIALIVCTDADTHSIDEIYKSFSDECTKVEPKMEDRTDKEPVLIWIPKRHIETWIEFFKNNGVGVNEERKYKINSQNVRCKEEANKMSEFLQGNRVYKEYLPSLEAAYVEYERLCKVQK
ncbi:MAG: hypothetical protein IJ608_10830 [Lachnospiraceae bacterium]|nr:hypothetical protein [Lachnospiraceae bacterium]